MMHSKHSLVASALALSIATTAGAQTAPRPVVKPSVNPGVAQTIARPGTISTGTTGSSTSSTGFLAAGPYKLGLHAQKKNNQTIAASDFGSQVSVARSGNAITIDAFDGTTLTGSVSGNTFHASGPSSSGGTLTLSGAVAADNGATGTFTAHDGSTTLTGTFAMYPGLSMGPTNTQKIQNYGDPKPSNGGGGSTCGFWCQLKQWFGL